MGWSIAVFKNTLRTDEKTAEKLLAKLDEQGYSMSYYPGSGFDFDDDAMEHMDMMWQNWAKEILGESQATNGDVIFYSMEGDDAGEAWGYRWKNGVEVPIECELKVEVSADIEDDGRGEG